VRRTNHWPVLAAAIVLIPGIASSRGEQPVAVRRLDGRTIPASAIDETVTSLMKAAEVPGLGLAILNDRRIVFLKGYGFRDSEDRRPLTVDTVMSGASFSKAAFAYLVMILVDDGVIDLDRPVERYLPKPLSSYPRYADLANDPRARKLTARILLSHTSGFPNWRAFEDEQVEDPFRARLPVRVLRRRHRPASARRRDGDRDAAGTADAQARLRAARDDSLELRLAVPVRRRLRERLR
jgi:CubicO group peptidase (beta-lactamase class C family)